MAAAGVRRSGPRGWMTCKCPSAPRALGRRRARRRVVATFRGLTMGEATSRKWARVQWERWGEGRCNHLGGCRRGAESRWLLSPATYQGAEEQAAEVGEASVGRTCLRPPPRCLRTRRRARGRARRRRAQPTPAWRAPRRPPPPSATATTLRPNPATCHAALSAFPSPSFQQTMRCAACWMMRCCPQPTSCTARPIPWEATVVRARLSLAATPRPTPAGPRHLASLPACCPTCTTFREMRSRQS